ncbi:MFS transporter [Paraburkholderia gardini]|uniref:MFS transporter n=1 Tax=Paraburkholderia gardini TaxID=2823469 RepID=UPI001D97DA09|nr:MFS transporter [Paraburkholderia gardini]CAG4897496.1 Hexuronate transporter [Paraburkholderia gardini]
MFPIATRWRGWVVVVMMFLFMLINFADKAVVGLAAVPMMHDLGLSPQQLGLVGSSFFLLFSISGVLFGFAANRIKTKWLLAVLSITWAVVQFPLAGTASFPLLIACRVVLGAGEGPAYPLALHATYKWFDNSRRNLPGAILLQGANTGMLVAGPVLTYLIIHYDWHSAFLALGLAGCVWTVVWLLLGEEGTVDDHAGASPVNGGVRASVPVRVRYRDLICDRTLLGCVVLTFVGYAVLSVGFTWFPVYLRLALGYPAADVGWLFSLIVCAGIPATLAISAASQWMAARGMSSRVSRGAMASVPIALAGLALFGTTMEIGAGAKVACLAASNVLSQLIFFFAPLMIAEVTPTSQRAAWLGINASLGTLAGLIAPALMGHFVGDAGGVAEGFRHGFTVLGCVLVPSGLLGVWLMNPERSVHRLQRLCPVNTNDVPMSAAGTPSRGGEAA